MSRVFPYVAAVFITLAVVIGVYLHGEANRYELVGSGQGPVYKIDRRTGQVWFVARGKEEPIGVSQSENLGSPEERAIELAKKSFLLTDDPEVYLADLRGQRSSSAIDAEGTIHNWLKTKRGSLTVHGWKARAIDDQTYLVSYTFDNEEQRDQGWFFEVNLAAGLVRDPTKDALLAKKYGFPAPPQLSPSEALKEIRRQKQ